MLFVRAIFDICWASFISMFSCHVIHVDLKGRATNFVLSCPFQMKDDKARRNDEGRQAEGRTKRWGSRMDGRGKSKNKGGRKQEGREEESRKMKINIADGCTVCRYSLSSTEPSNYYADTTACAKQPYREVSYTLQSDRQQVNWHNFPSTLDTVFKAELAMYW